MPVDVVVLVCAPPVLTVTPGGPEAVVAAEEVEVPAGAEAAEEVADAAVGGPPGLDVPVSGLVADEFVGDAPFTAAEELESDDDESDGPADATPWCVTRQQTPRATTKPPIRPTYASPRTRQL